MRLTSALIIIRSDAKRKDPVRSELPDVEPDCSVAYMLYG